MRSVTTRSDTDPEPKTKAVHSQGGKKGISKKRTQRWDTKRESLK